MKNKVLKALVSIMLIIVLTLADFILVGIDLATYALENLSNSTSNENVKFAAYFKTEEKEVSQMDYEMTNNEMKLFLEIAVQNEGYFDGVVTLENSNFKLKNKLNEGINKIEGNTITLNRVRAGNTVEIEVEVEPIIEESYEESMLNKESTLKLTGTYKDATEKNISIEAEKKVTLNLLAPVDLETTLVAKVITNRKYKIGDANKRIVQIELNSTVIENAYPIKTTTFELALPEGTESVEVISKGTYVTNGEADRKLEENKNYTWDKANNKIEVKIENTNKDGKISWKKDVSDNIIVTLLLPEETQITEKEYSVKSKVEVYGQEEKTIEKEVNYNLSTEADGIIRVSVDKSEKIYKGKIYSKEEREYQTTTNIEVNYANLIEESSIEEKTVYRVEKDAENKNSNIEYKTTTINKSEIEKVLGQEGTLTIKNELGEEIQKITKDTPADENGNIVVTYNTGIKALNIQITKAVSTGVIRLNHTKVIKSETYSKEEIDAIKYLVEESTVKYKTAEYTFEKIKELGEIKSEVGLTITPQTISAEETKEMQIAITLKTDNEKYELFENPTFTLTMPEGVTINSVSNGADSALYGGLAISKLEKVNSRELKVEIAGAQTEYVKSNINTQINFTANISVNKLMANKIDIIKMQYENKGKTYNVESDEINIVASNAKMATYLKIENYNGQGAKLEKYSDNAEQVKGEIPVENTEKIKVPLTYTIINNYGIEMPVTVKIVATLTDKYENTQDLINYSNADISLNAGEMNTINYALELPAGLYYSEKVDIQASVEYQYQGTQYNVPNKIELATESKEGIRDITIIDNKLQVETFAQFGDETGIKESTEIYNEQIITYIIEVTNISNETISNLTITNKQDNGNIYDLKEILMETWTEEGQVVEHRYSELDTNTKTFAIDALVPGESRQLECRVVAKKTEQSDIISANISILADGIVEKNLSKVSNKVKTSNIKIVTEKALNEEVQLRGENTLSILTYVQNLTDTEIKNLKSRIYLSDGLTFLDEENLKAINEKNEYVSIIENISYNEEEGYIEFEITNLEPNKEIILKSDLYIEEIPLEEVSKNVSVYVDINNIISNMVKINVEQVKTEFSVVQTVNVAEGQKVKNGEKVTFTAEIKNIGNVDSYVTISDRLPTGLEPTKVELIRNNQTENIPQDQQEENVIINSEIKVNETIVVKIEAIVNTSKISSEELTNKFIVSAIATESAISNEITIVIESDVDNSTGPEEPEIQEPENTDPELPKDVEPEQKPEDESPEDTKPGDEGEEEQEQTYTLSGYVWVDKNENQNKEADEVIENVIVKIIDLDNNNIFVKDKDGNEIEVKTDKNGLYEIKELPKGNYNLIFKYDTETYELKANNDLKDYIIESTKEKVAITNSINLEADTTINLELMELTEFNLKIDKYISKVIVQTVNGTKTSTYSKQQLVRDEIQKKYLSGATVLVEYTIEISNIGELAGYATEIIDYLPSDMKFYSELNTQWYMGEDKNLYNTTLASVIINPGETKTIKLILSKTMNSENTGTTSNIAEISKTMNNKEYADIDLNNNQSKAEIIINIATGTIITYVIAVLNSIVILFVGLYMIKRKVVGKEK